MAQMCPTWGTFAPFKQHLYRKGSNIIEVSQREL